MHLHRLTRRGASLIEILVVIAIITVLSTLSFFAFNVARRFGDKLESDVGLVVTQVNQSQQKERPGATPIVASKPPSAPARPKIDRVPGQYYVGFNASVNDPAAEAQRLAGLVGGQIINVYTTGIFGFGLACEDSRTSRLAGDPAVAFIDQARYVYPAQVGNNIKRIFSNGIYGDQNQLSAKTTTMYGVPKTTYQMRLDTRQSIVGGRVFLSGTTSATIPIAIMDTGIDNTHPDLFVARAVDFTGGNDPMDRDGHGTHVAGVVGAVDRTSNNGVIGVYPGAPLISLKVMNSPTGGEGLAVGNTFNVLNALLYVSRNSSSIRICLMSFEMTGTKAVNDMVDAVAGLGVIMVAAAGNGNVDVSAGAGVSPATATQAIVVGAITDSDGVARTSGGRDGTAGYSNFGTRVDFAAPGGDSGTYLIRSTVPLAGQTKNNLGSPYSTQVNGDSGRNAQGTSYAAAHVAGMLGLMLDPNTSAGFVIGGRAVPTYRYQMNSYAGARNSLYSLTHQTARMQIISPAGSAWIVSGFPRRVTPYTIQLHDDVVGSGNLNGKPIPNFYVNPNQAPSNLPVFSPG